jgi:hypothetical protein
VRRRIPKQINKPVRLSRPSQFDQACNKERLYSPPRLRNPSEEIRLLRILLASGFGHLSVIECELETMTFRRPSWDRIAYKALSYTWGTATTPSDVTHVVVNRKLVCIRNNLWDFLNAMRQLDKHSPFWIDALCIDQLSTIKKEMQLKLIPEVYLNTVEVIVWLGVCDGKELTDALLELYVQCAGGRYRREQHQTAARRQAFKYLVENKY